MRLADDLSPCSAETSRKSVALIYPEPLGPTRPVAGHLYFYYFWLDILCVLSYVGVLHLQLGFCLLCQFLSN